MGDSIAYRGGYKYVLAEPYGVQTAVIPATRISRWWFSLDSTGYLLVAAGYAWDGPSGPAIDTPSFMRGSLIHDCLYQQLREGLLPQAWREVADRELVRICREDGMSRLRAWWVYHGVRLGGGPAARPSGSSPILRVP